MLVAVTSDSMETFNVNESENPEEQGVLVRVSLGQNSIRISPPWLQKQ